VLRGYVACSEAPVTAERETKMESSETGREKERPTRKVEKERRAADLDGGEEAELVSRDWGEWFEPLPAPLQLSCTHLGDSTPASPVAGPTSHSGSGAHLTQQRQLGIRVTYPRLFPEEWTLRVGLPRG
jgi:hypothetical protein